MTPNTSATGQSKEFIISRTFDAPRDLVWKCFTDPEHMKHWWGPKGFRVRVSKMDLRVGGRYHYALEASNGEIMWGKMAFREIAPPQRLVWINSFSDETGGTARHPWHMSWPLEMFTVVTFEEQDGTTLLTVRWSPHNATEEECRTFDAGRDSMRMGWTGTLDQLTAYLATVDKT
jgi:uncharacterized protein YndB with AHSA1/START domain